MTNRPGSGIAAVGRPRIAALILLGLMCSGAAARADTVADFYRGKTITFIIGYGPGGGVDSASRLIIRHLARFMLARFARRHPRWRRGHGALPRRTARPARSDDPDLDGHQREQGARNRRRPRGIE